MNIVLVPGWFDFGHFRPSSYFNGVTRHLQSVFPSANILPTNPVQGPIAYRADLLGQQIYEGIFAGDLDPSQPFHILAHSIGGLDARLLVAKNLYGMGRRVASITAIGTPHLGLPVATVLNRLCSLKEVLSPLGLFGNFLSEMGTNMVSELSGAVACRFNAECPDNPRVQYFEVVGVGRSSTVKTSLLLLPTFLFMSAVSGPNDGMVPFVSATRERKPAAIWLADHADMIGHNLDRLTGASVSRFHHLAAYEDLVHRIISSQKDLGSHGRGKPG